MPSELNTWDSNQFNPDKYKQEITYAGLKTPKYNSFIINYELEIKIKNIIASVYA